MIEHYSIVRTHLVPTMFVRLLRDRKSYSRQYDLSSLRMVLHGAAPVSRQIKREMIAWWGEVLVEYWGASESGIITRVDSVQWLAHPGTVGKPLAHFEVSVRDEVFNELARGQIGSLYARKSGAPRPYHYFNDNEKTEGAYVDDWFTLGDLGWQDESGYIYIADRRSNLIISGGVNIYPAEVEGVLLEHGSVADVAVIGLADEEWGKRVHAIVQPVPGRDPTDNLVEELLDFARTRLAKFKIPRSVEIVESLPRYDSGKLYLNRLGPSEPDR
jgi:long-chain acyl-CoA synthetase